MSREKQIEEMAKVIGTVPPVEIYGGRGYGKKVFYATHIAEHLCINGYRKTSDTAREIFEEISKASVNWGCYCLTLSKSAFLTEDVNRTLAELKKKYTGEDINVTTNTEEGK